MSLVWTNLEVFWLLLPIIITLFIFSEIWNGLRLFISLCLVLLLAHPQVEWESGQPRVTVLLDQSDSCQYEVKNAYREIEELLKSSRPADGILETYAFARDTVLWPMDEKVDLGQQETKLQSSLLYASKSIPSNDHSKLLLVSDGWSTESLQQLPAYLSKKEQELYWYQVNQDSGEDYRLKSFNIPEQSFQNESFLLDIEVEGPGDKTQVEVMRGSTSMGRFEVELKGGRGQLRLKDRLQQPGSYPYSARLIDERDQFNGNNRMKARVQVEGQGMVMLISSYVDDPLAKSFEKMGLKVHLVNDYKNLEVGQLSNAQAVVIHNVAASDIPLTFLKALVPYVEIQGGGLAMIGGDNSFASGGYYHSQIDPLLPVSMELKEDKYKITLALGIILDRSGSMMASTSSGRTKMQLANEGAATAIELLGRNDAVTVYAVDSIAHCIIELSQIDSGKEMLANRVRQIQSQGGGIFVYEGLVNTWERMMNAPMQNKHIILFSDAADSEQPGEYKRLLEEMQNANCAVSVIGLGGRGDPDAAFLEDIAKRGGGRMFFAQDAMDLPAIFTQETAAVSRSTFIEEARQIAKTGQLVELGLSVPTPSRADAFNLCQSRKDAHTALVTNDEEQDPILAFWHRGSGKALAFMSPLAGEFSSSMLNDASYDAFNASWIRWLLKSPVPAGMAIEQRRVGDKIEMDLYFDSEWQSKFAKTPPIVKFVELNNIDQKKSIPWERLQPGQFKTRLSLDPNNKVVGAISIGNTHLSFGPFELGHSTEWFPPQSFEHELRQVARMSGGGMAPRLDKLWEFDPTLKYQSLRPWLCVVVILLILIEMLFYKLGWSLVRFPKLLNISARFKKESNKPVGEIIPDPPKEVKEEVDDLFKQRLDRFKRRK